MFRTFYHHILFSSFLLSPVSKWIGSLLVYTPRQEVLSETLKRILMQTYCMVLEFYLMGASEDCRVVVSSKWACNPNRWWLPLIETVTNIYKQWVLYQKVCGLSPMQWKYWTFLVIGQAPHWVLLFTSIKVRAWDQGGWEVCPVKWHQNPEDHKINIARPILARLKEKCFLLDFSRICAAQAKAIMVKKQLRMLQYSLVLNQVGQGGRKYQNKV